MSNKNIEWSKAPEDATHCCICGHGMYFLKAVSTNDCFAYTSGSWCKIGFPWNSEIIRRPEKPTLNIGDDVVVVNDKGYGISYGHDVLGEKCKLMARYKSTDGVNVCVIDYHGGGYVFRDEMIRPWVDYERERINKEIGKLQEELERL